MKAPNPITMRSTSNTSPIHAIAEIRIRPPTKDSESLQHIIGHVKSQALDILKESIFLTAGNGMTPTLRAVCPYAISANLAFGDDADHCNVQGRPMFFRNSCSIHVFVHAEDESMSENNDDDEDQAFNAVVIRDDEASALTQVAQVVELPSVKLEMVWEHLHFEDGVKQTLMGYARAVNYLGRLGVDGNIIGWNGMLLLHGEPGTGKTTLCRALAQKVAIRVDARNAVLVEVHLEQLLSKWFAESSQRVRTIFERVMALAKCRDFVFVILDEVESIGLSRKRRLDAAEPGDAIRVVNSLLGGIDALRELHNCIVMCTSNLIDGIDEALLDRADLSLHVGVPSDAARMRIITEVVGELAKKGVVAKAKDGNEETNCDMWTAARVCQVSHGLSGRALRKLAIAALASLRLDMPGIIPIDETVLLQRLAQVAAQLSVRDSPTHLHGENSTKPDVSSGSTPTETAGRKFPQPGIGQAS